MIDGNAIFDNEGVADLGRGFTLTDWLDGRYLFSSMGNHATLSRDEVYNLGIALARLSDAQSSGKK